MRYFVTCSSQLLLCFVYLLNSSQATGNNNDRDISPDRKPTMLYHHIIKHPVEQPRPFSLRKPSEVHLIANSANKIYRKTLAKPMAFSYYQKGDQKPAATADNDDDSIQVTNKYIIENFQVTEKDNDEQEHENLDDAKRGNKNIDDHEFHEHATGANRNLSGEVLQESGGERSAKFGNQKKTNNYNYANNYDKNGNIKEGELSSVKEQQGLPDIEYKNFKENNRGRYNEDYKKNDNQKPTEENENKNIAAHKEADFYDSNEEQYNENYGLKVQEGTEHDRKYGTRLVKYIEGRTENDNKQRGIRGRYNNNYKDEDRESVSDERERTNKKQEIRNDDYLNDKKHITASEEQRENPHEFERISANNDSREKYGNINEDHREFEENHAERVNNGHGQEGNEAQESGYNESNEKLVDDHEGYRSIEDTHEANKKASGGQGGSKSHAASGGTIANQKHEKGGGKKHHSDHHSAEGDKGDKSYKGYHDHEKAEKGHHDKEGHAGSYSEKGGSTKKHHGEHGTYGQYHKEGKGKKSAEYEEKGEHNKGHNTKGEHNINKNDDFEEKHVFYDEYHEGGEEEKHGGHKEEDDFHKGGHKKGSHHDVGEHYDTYGKKGHHEKGTHYKESKGHKLQKGHGDHHEHGDKYEKKDGKEGAKKWHYAKGNGGAGHSGAGHLSDGGHYNTGHNKAEKINNHEKLIEKDVENKSIEVHNSDDHNKATTLDNHANIQKDAEINEEDY